MKLNGVLKTKIFSNIFHLCESPNNNERLLNEFLTVSLQMNDYAPRHLKNATHHILLKKLILIHLSRSINIVMYVVYLH